MSDDLRYQCRRRSTRRRPPVALPTGEGRELVRAGSGGGDTVYGSQTVYFQGYWKVGAGDVSLHAEDHSLGGTDLKEADPELRLCALTEDGSKGRAYLRGDQGARITSGLPHAPEISNEGICGIELQAGNEQYVNIMRGMDPWGNDQRMTFAPHGIVVHSGVGQITLEAADEITLRVAGGTQTLTLMKTGITLNGTLIHIN